jgi:hypothetical protein
VSLFDLGDEDFSRFVPDLAEGSVGAEDMADRLITFVSVTQVERCPVRIQERSKADPV